MMARSMRSNQRPDTLMQDRSLPTRQNSLATHGRTIHWGSLSTALQRARVTKSGSAKANLYSAAASSCQIPRVAYKQPIRFTLPRWGPAKPARMAAGVKWRSGEPPWDQPPLGPSLDQFFGDTILPGENAENNRLEANSTLQQTLSFAASLPRHCRLRYQAHLRDVALRGVPRRLQQPRLGLDCHQG
jgi:hypothetical protein